MSTAAVLKPQCLARAAMRPTPLKNSRTWYGCASCFGRSSHHVHSTSITTTLECGAVGVSMCKSCNKATCMHLHANNWTNHWQNLKVWILMRSFWSTKCNKSSHKDIELGRCHGDGELGKGIIRGKLYSKGFCTINRPSLFQILQLIQEWWLSKRVDIASSRFWDCLDQ